MSVIDSQFKENFSKYEVLVYPEEEYKHFESIMPFEICKDNLFDRDRYTHWSQKQAGFKNELRKLEKIRKVEEGIVLRRHQMEKNKPAEFGQERRDIPRISDYMFKMPLRDFMIGVCKRNVAKFKPKV